MVEEKNDILYVSFNQDSSCFAIGRENGFQIYSCTPFSLNIDRSINTFKTGLNNGFAIVEMLYRSNIIALKGGGNNNKYGGNTLLLWNDEDEKIYREIKVVSEILSIKLKKDKIFLVTTDTLYVYSLIELNCIDSIKIFEQSQGVMAVSYDYRLNILAYPERLIGYVRVKSYDNSLNILIQAQKSAIACLALNSEGSLLATSSVKGNYIKIFLCSSGEKLLKVTRGSDNAEVYSMCFNMRNEMLACTSNRGTVHIFSLHSISNKLLQNENLNEKKNIPENKKTIFGKIYGFTKLRIPDSKPICSFGQESTIIVISEDGKFYRAIIMLDGSECSKVEEYNLNDVQ